MEENMCLKQFSFVLTTITGRESSIKHILYIHQLDGLDKFQYRYSTEPG